MGPTNSGKTKAAIEALKNSKSGIYCAPLRLLAWEVSQKLNQEGVKCNLTTGQESRVDMLAKHLACTVEMADLRNEYDVAVIDEIQMIGDQQRGPAWTNALLGLRAKEIHLCGQQRALELVHNLCEVNGDELVQFQYLRLSDLKVQKKPLASLEQIRHGDCIVSFQVAMLATLKKEINTLMNLKNKTMQENYCAMIYGSLPAETKRTQANLYNSGALKYLLATDAIGMGMNLNIKRVIFWNTLKNTAMHGLQQIDKHYLLQIAGRAGRFKDTGYVSAFSKKDLDYVNKCFQGAELMKNEQVEISKSGEIIVNVKAESENDSEDDEHGGTQFTANQREINKACLFPPFHLIDQFSDQLYLHNFAGSEPKIRNILETFKTLSTLDNNYFFRDIQQILQIAQIVERVEGLSLRMQFHLIICPIQSRFLRNNDQLYITDVISYVESMAKGEQIQIPQRVQFTYMSQFKEKHLSMLIQNHNLLEIYIWLSRLYPELFNETEKAREIKEIYEQLISGVLEEQRVEIIRHKTST